MLYDFDVLQEEKVNELKETLNQMGEYQFQAINNGSIVNYFIHDVIVNSSVVKRHWFI